MKTPIVLIIFKRPDTTEKVFQAIRQIKAPLLFVIADGPRHNRPGEAEQCAATRAIIDRIDWDCEVIKNYSEVNLGCGKRIATGLNWVFDQVEEAIILEDDCLPHITFFQFCDDLLERYRSDTRIMSISSLSVPHRRENTENSYHFSRYCRSWGWATWRRAWKHFDFDMKIWPSIKDNGWLKDILINSKYAQEWTHTFNSIHNSQRLDIWDYQWLLACWIQSGLSILPSSNLVTNIGFGPEATHTSNSNSHLANLPLEGISFPLNHPNFVIRDAQADNYIQETVHEFSKFWYIKSHLKRQLGFSEK